MVVYDLLEKLYREVQGRTLRTNDALDRVIRELEQ